MMQETGLFNDVSTALFIFLMFVSIAIIYFGIYVIKKGDTIEIGIIFVATGITIAIISFTAITVIGVYNDIKKDKINTYEKAYEMIENGADIYIDGQKIDPDTIILEHYKITIKEDDIFLRK